jgi:DNA polymerase-3 subunit delta'
MHWSVIGHMTQKASLERMLAQGTLPHALLLAGPDGVGKRAMAEDILTTLVPAEARMLDTLRLSPMTDEDGGIAEVSVEQVREMRRWASFTPTTGRKVVVMDEAERMNAECANTLLKLLEEPPAYAHFLLVTGNPASVMPTIASRCQRIDFKPLSESEMGEVLAGRKLNGDDRALLAMLAGGRPGVVLGMLERGELKVAAQAIADLQTALKEGDGARIALAGRIAERGNAAQVTGWWLSYVHARLPEKPHLAPLLHNLIDLHDAVSNSSFNARLALEHSLLTVKN